MTGRAPATTAGRAGVALLLLSATGVPLSGCGSPDGGPATASGLLGTTAAELDRDVFLPSCAFGACHGATRPAARLDLGQGICAARALRPSCLFPEQQLIVPGHPEQSFLIDKLTGEKLASQPATDCSTTGNARMPYGGTPLSPSTIERVQAWIRAGATCPSAGTGGAGGSATVVGAGGSTAVEPGGAAGADGAAGAGGTAGGGTGWRVAFETPTAHVRSGDRVSMTVTLTPAAGPAGVVVDLSPDDPSALGVPGAVFIPAGADRVTFEIQGKRPSPKVRLTATAADARVEAVVAVDGLFLAEVFYGGATVASGGDHSQWVKLVNATAAPIDLGAYQVVAGRAGAVETALALGGILDPGQCALVGGPDSTAANGYPAYTIDQDFSPDLPRVNQGQAEVTVAIVAAPAASADATGTSPAPPSLDAISAGGVAAGGAGTVAVTAKSLAPGHSLARTGPSTWTDLGAPTPNACSRWW